MSGRRHSAVAGTSAGLLTQPQGSHGGCSSMLRSEEGEAVCCVSQVASAPSVRTDAVFVERTAVLRWFLSVLVGPAVAYCPNRRRVVTANPL